jgi:exopolysaccharide biosynthesis polyprenyl glycosylphosphotransferase
MFLDTVILLIAFIIAARVVYPDTSLANVFSSHFNLFVFAFGILIVSFTALGLYRTVSYTPMKHHYLSATKAFIYCGAIVLSALFLSGNIFYPRKFLVVLFLALPVVYVGVWFTARRIFRLVQQRGYGKWNTLVIGPGKNIESLLHRFESFPDLGYEPVKIMKTPVYSSSDRKLHVNSGEIEQAIVDQRVEFMVLSSPDLNGSYDVLEGLCRKHYVRMRVVSPETDTLFKQTRIHDIAGLPLFSPMRSRIDASKRFAKRAFDIFASIVLLILLAPLFILVAIATKLESNGPVFFKQQRSLSDRDEPFLFYKFRSMYHEADEKKESLFVHNESNGALFKMKNDPRLTRVGKFIRRYSIDELPQLFNVLRGEMSLVGPRPLPISDFRRIQENEDVGGYFRGRAKAKPGMTGLWQVSGRSHLGFQEMVMLDLYYIENQSLLFDIEILAQTVPVVLFGKGAY